MSFFTSFTPPRLSSGDEVIYVQEEIRRIERTTMEPRSLHQYVDLCRRLNAIRSTTCALPNGVLSLIFQHVSPPLSYLDEEEEDWPLHLLLRLVSSHWYYVVHSTPCLWTCVRAGPRGVNARFGQYLKLCLDNSGSLLLTILLRFRSEEYDPRFLVSHTADDALRCNLHRIKSLSVYAASVIWLSVIPQMFQLNTLFLFLSNDTIPEAARSSTMDLSRLSRIRLFSVSSPCMYDINLGPAAFSITTLEFAETPIDICIRLYLICHNVSDFRCHQTQIPPRSALLPEVPTSLLKREYLTTLTFELLADDLSHWNDYLFKWTQFLALKTLVLSFSPSNYDTTTFFRRLPNSLNDLHFEAVTPLATDSESLIEHIRHDCNISLIQLEDCNEVFLNNVFRNLFKKTTAEGEEIIPFPNLIHLSVDIRDNEYKLLNLTDDAGKRFVQLLEERKDIIKKFTFESTNELDEWEDETWSRLEELVRDGLALEIYSPQGIWPVPDDLEQIYDSESTSE